MTEPKHTFIRVSRTTWIALGIALLLPWIVVLWIARAPASSPPKAAAVTVAPKAGTKPEGGHLPAGPWGDLEFVRITIEPPEDCIPTASSQPDSIRWVFKGYTVAKLSALWQSAGLTPAQQKFLESPERRETTGDTIVLKPDAGFVTDLNPAARATLYTALAEFPENASQQSPFRLRKDAAADWFEQTGLPPEIVALTKRLLYERNANVLFSDEDIVLPRLQTTAERIRFLKTLSRKSTLLVQLKVPPGADTSTLSRYWGRGRRSKDVAPLLESLSRVPGGATIDLAHLLPPFPRSLLYGFPLPSDKPEVAAHDCHWTSLNFFNERPDERFSNIDFVRQTLLNDYYPVAGEPTYGDVMVLVQPNGVVVHSCVYLAAGIVFTKNGSPFSVPWLLGNLDAVVAFYTIGPPLSVRTYRAKLQ